MYSHLLIAAYDFVILVLSDPSLFDCHFKICLTPQSGIVILLQFIKAFAMLIHRPYPPFLLSSRPPETLYLS